jgi:TonB family protein
MRQRQLLVMVALAAAFSAPAIAQDRPPDWLKRPSSSDIQGVWPTEAYRRGDGGKATISCAVTVQGTLRDCKVVSEEPSGAGFGGAALALTKQFVMRPALRDGKPVESTARIPINFPRFVPMQNALPPAKHSLVYTQLPWRQAPTYADVLAAYPAKAKAEKVGGVAALDCEIKKDGALGGCRTLKEAPKGYGFLDAAKKLAPKFVTPTTDGKGLSVAGSRAHVTIAFAAAALDNPAPVIGRPRWMAAPAINDLAAVVPAEAKKAKVYKARVVMTCRVVAEGKVEGCEVQSEEPVGLGYGRAAASLSPYFRLAVWTDEGLPSVGGTVRIPLRFDLDSVMAETEAAPPRTP